MSGGNHRISPKAPRAVYYALTSNIAVAVCKYLAAFYTNSGSALAEALHSSADCLNQLVLLLGNRSAQAPPDEQHPLGFGRERYFYALLVALQIFLVGGLASVFVGIARLVHRSPLAHPYVVAGVLCASGIVEGFALKASISTIGRERRRDGILNWFRESGSPEIMLSVGEDVAALTGIGLSLLAVGLSILTGDPLYDALGGIAVGLVLMGTAVFSIREIKSLIVGESAPPMLRDSMHSWLTDRPEIRRVVSMVALRWAGDLVVAIQVELQPHDSADELVRTIDHIENELKQQFPRAKWIYLEPELREHGTHPL